MIRTINERRSLICEVVFLLMAGALASAQATSSCVSIYNSCVSAAATQLQICRDQCGIFCTCDSDYNDAIAQCQAHGSQAVYYLQTIQHVNQLYCNGQGSGWSNGDLTAATGFTLAASNSPLADTYSSPTEATTYYVGTNQHVYQFYWNGSAWSNGDVTAGAGGPVSSSNSGISVLHQAPYYTVNYIGSDQHVRQLTWNGSTWVNVDLTGIYGGGVLAASNSSMTSYLYGASQVLYYVGANQDVYQFYINASPPYNVSNGDVIAATGGPQVVNGGALSSFITTGGPGQGVYYIGTDQHVHQLYWTGSIWTNGDVTAAAGGTLAAIGALASNGAHGQEVYYIGTNQHVYQLYWTGSVWTNGDITAATGAPLASVGSALTSPLEDPNFFAGTKVYFVGTNQHVFELFWNGSTWSQGDLTNTLALSSSALSSFATK